MLNGEHRYERQICRGRAAAARRVLTWTESHFVASKVRFGFDKGKASCHHFPPPTHHHHDHHHDHDRIMTRRSGTPAQPSTRLCGNYGRLAGEGWGLLRSNSSGESDIAISLDQNILSLFVFSFCLRTYLELQLHYWKVGSCLREGKITMRKTCKMQSFLER